MLKRAITSIAVVLFTIAFYLLRLIEYRLFDIYPYVLAVLASIELVKANKDEITKIQKLLVVAFTLTVFPIAVFLRIYITHYVTLYMSFAIVVSVLTTKNEEKDGLSKTVFALFYPTIPLLSLVYINAMGRYAPFIIVTTVLSTWFSDTFAYIVGSIFKGPKLCPNLSPNKTISGSIGSLIGGILATSITYLSFLAFGFNAFYGVKTFTIVLFLIMSGILFSITTQIGDLVESYIERRLNVKDMGSILPGHGGVLDRIDGLTFCALISFALYSFLL